MSGSYERNGIIFFNEPFEVKRTDWIYKHLDCDSIIENGDFSNSMITVICYAKSEVHNIALKLLRDKDYHDKLILRGISHEEVNCI